VHGWCAALLLWGCGEGRLETTDAPAPGEPAGGAGGPPEAAGGAGGGSERPPGEDPPREVPPGPPVQPSPATLHRLTRTQYANSVRHVLGDVRVPDDLEVDTPLHGFNTVGASELTISPRAAEQFEAAALDVTGQVFDDPARRAALVGCDAANAACVRDALARLGRRAWRRPLAPEEVDRFAGLHAELTGSFRDPWAALRFTIAAMLQSPDFLFRVEVGEPDPSAPAKRRYTNHEMASRLAYFLWASPPDDALLDAADRGELVTDAGLRAQTERMLADPRARDAMRAYFGEFLALGELDHLEKDRAAFPQMSDTLGKSMRAEIEAVVDHLVFERDADFRELLTTRETFVNAELAALYNLPAPADDGFAPVELPANGARGGLLSMAGVLAVNAHNTVTSPTRRGKFVQSNLLCFDIPPPPPGVATNLDGVGGEGPQTTRMKLARHAVDPTCNGCHQHMDPIGLALENFDAIGAWRTTENGLPIDASAEIAGVPVDGARALGALVREDDQFGDCMARRMYRHATGHLEEPGELGVVRRLGRDFREGGHRVKALATAIVLSEGFRGAAAPSDATETPAEEGN
jgi:hypothetical protein